MFPLFSCFVVNIIIVETDRVLIMVRQVDSMGVVPVQTVSESFNCKKVQALGLRVSKTASDSIGFALFTVSAVITLFFVGLAVGTYNSIKNSFNTAMMGLKNTHLAR